MAAARLKTLLAATVVALLATFSPQFVSWSAPTPIRVPAFPGAEGYGAYSVGGRGGRVIPVTTLADSGPGSFRAAVGAEGPRTVVFRVSGVIEAKSRFQISSPFLTVAGQTAPGDGITLQATEQNAQILWIQTHDVVIRHLTIRGGPYGPPGEGQVNVFIGPRPAHRERYGNIYNVVLDHLSTSWSLDENIAIFRNVPKNDPTVWEAFPTISNISIQHCLLAEGLYPHSTGLAVGGERIEDQGRTLYNGGSGVQRISVHRNLFASNSHRNPALGAAAARVINNVIYNWGSKASETHDSIQADWIGNYYKPGPLSAHDSPLVHNDFFRDYPQHRFDPPSIHMDGNILAAEPERRDWELYVIHYEEPRRLPESYRRHEPLPVAAEPVQLLDAPDAYWRVIADVGSRARTNLAGGRVFRNDPVDQRILSDVRLGRGPGHNHESTHYSDPKQAGITPALLDGPAYRDGDQDGMADDWELRFGFDPGNPDPSDGDRDEDGYTDLEEFLNQTDPLLADELRLPPSNDRRAPRRSR